MPYKDKSKDKECKARWQKANAKAHRNSVSDYQKRNTEKQLARQSEWRASNPEKHMLQSARIRARKLGLEFSIELSDIVIPKVCPVFGTPIHRPSLDRIDSSKGYTKDNVWVISWRANRLKSDATLKELENLVSALRKLQAET